MRVLRRGENKKRANWLDLVWYTCVLMPDFLFNIGKVVSIISRTRVLRCEQTFPLGAQDYDVPDPQPRLHQVHYQ